MTQLTQTLIALSIAVICAAWFALGLFIGMNL